MDDTTSPLDRITRQRPVGTEELTFALNPNDAQRLLEQRSALRRAQAALSRAQEAAGRANPSADVLEAAEAAAGEHEMAKAALDERLADLVTFTVHLRAVGPRRVEELFDDHPPTKEAKAKARAAANGDPKAEPRTDEDTFAPAFLAEAVTRIEFSDGGDPVTSLSVSQADDLWRSPWPQGDRDMLLNTALLLNQMTTSVDLGKD